MTSTPAPASAGSAGADTPPAPPARVGAPGSGGLTRRWRPDGPLDPVATLRPLRRGAGDPTFRLEPGVLWRATGTPAGPATLRLTRDPDGTIVATAWGAGRRWILEQLPELLGEGDDWTDLDIHLRSGRPTATALLRDTRRARPGVRICRTTVVHEALIPAILEQKVVGLDAFRAWRYLVLRYGDPAPGPAPAGLTVCPSPSVWLSIPAWEWHRAGVDLKRTETVRAACRVAAGLQRTVDRGRGGPEVIRLLRTVPGIGIWTAAETVQRAHGDPDTVSVGDFHLSRLVGWALIGRPVDDDGMLEILEPYAGSRQRVVRLIEISGFSKPRFGPRMTRVDHRFH